MTRIKVSLGLTRRADAAAELVDGYMKRRLNQRGGDTCAGAARAAGTPDGARIANLTAAGA